MKIRTAIIVIIIIAIAAGIWTMLLGRSERVNIVPAWLLTPKAAYVSQSLGDPVVSWSPDSKSLLFAAASAKTYRSSIFRWEVGNKQIDRVLYGTSPSYINNDKFIFLQQNPKVIFERDLETGRMFDLVPNLHKVDFWKEIGSVSYIPAHKSISLYFSNFTQYYEAGCTEIDLNGKALCNIPRTTGGGVLDRSNDPKGGQSAVIIGDLTGTARELRIARLGEEKNAEPIASGNLGAVAWSPNGRVVVFAESNKVKVLDLVGKNIITVARFGEIVESKNAPYVCRLVWSPDGKYLAALELVPHDDTAYMMIYVLDMSKLDR